MSDFWDRLRRALEGPNLSDQWEDTLLLGAALDAAIAPDLDPEYLESFEFTVILSICGPRKLFEFHPKGCQHCFPHGTWTFVRVHGGLLDNDQLFLSLWGFGHEVGHNLDLHPRDLDHLCEGLPQEGAWREAYAQGGVLDGHAGPLILDPMFYKPITFQLKLELCGPERLRQAAGLDDDVVRVLGGMLANGRRYLSQAALGQALVRQVSGVNNPCEGL